jgi:hypothetical protein
VVAPAASSSGSGSSSDSSASRRNTKASSGPHQLRAELRQARQRLVHARLERVDAHAALVLHQRLLLLLRLLWRQLADGSLAGLALRLALPLQVLRHRLRAGRRQQPRARLLELRQQRQHGPLRRALRLESLAQQRLVDEHEAGAGRQARLPRQDARRLLQLAEQRQVLQRLAGHGVHGLLVLDVRRQRQRLDRRASAVGLGREQQPVDGRRRLLVDDRYACPGLRAIAP